MRRKLKIASFWSSVVVWGIIFAPIILVALTLRRMFRGGRSEYMNVPTLEEQIRSGGV